MTAWDFRAPCPRAPLTRGFVANLSAAVAPYPVRGGFFAMGDGRSRLLGDLTRHSPRRNCAKRLAPSYRLLIDRAFSHCNRRRGPVRDWNEFTQPSDPSDWAWADGGRGKLKVGRMIGWLVSAAAAALQKQVPITTVNLT